MKNLLNISLTLFFTAIIVLGFAVPVNPPGWYQQPLPVNDQINDIYFINAQTGWIVTNGSNITSDTSYIMKTTDGGTSWAIQNLRMEQLNGVQFLDANTGYVVGGLRNSTNVSLYKTTNGGTNWTDLNNLGGIQIIDLAFTSKDTGWVTLSAPLTNVVLKTENGGMNWSQQYGQSGNLGRIFMLNKDTGWFNTQSANGQLYRTTNGGANWGLLYTWNTGLANLFFVSKDTGFITGGFYMKKTIDGGFTWDTTYNNNGGRGIFFLNNKYGWVCDVFSLVQRTTDGGINWFRQTVPSGNYYSIFFIDTNTGWTGGTKLIKTDDGGGPPVGIEIISTEVPDEYILYQNYPNPFNPVTNIKYTVKRQTSKVKLMVFDINGREILKLVDNEQTTGTYEVDFDGSKYPSGVYFYSLYSEGRLLDTKKLILIK